MDDVDCTALDVQHSNPMDELEDIRTYLLYIQFMLHWVLYAVRYVCQTPHATPHTGCAIQATDVATSTYGKASTDLYASLRL